MDSTIIASLISAVASVVVALISKGGTSARAPEQAAAPRRNVRIWIATICILIAWMSFAALFLHWDTAGVTSILAVPLVTWILAAAFPIQPGIAAAVPLFLFPLAFLAEPIGKWRRGINFENHFEPVTVAAFVGTGFATALIAWLIARWRIRSSWATVEVKQQSAISSTIAKGLSELAELHRAGVLSDEEFTRAKNKLLSE
jgi:hypothetical protein